MRTTVADHLLSRLREWGVARVYGYPGDGINGILGAFSRADDDPRFIQSRHEEMSAFEAVGEAKFGDGPGICLATSGPGAIHLLNGLYDAKLDHVPVVAIVGQTNRSAIGGSYQQEVDLLSLFKDVASDYVQMVTVPQQLPNVLDRAIRTAMTRRAPTAVIVPNDVQELAYEPPGHEFKMVPSSLGISWPEVDPDGDALRAAADVLNAGSKVAVLVGQGARGAHEEVQELAALAREKTQRAARPAMEGSSRKALGDTAVANDAATAPPAKLRTSAAKDNSTAVAVHRAITMR